MEKFKLCEQLDKDQLYGIITPIRLNKIKNIFDLREEKIFILIKI